MIDIADIERALVAKLPAAPRALLATLARVLADAANNVVSAEQVQQRLAAPALATLLGQLAGQQLRVGDAVLSFEQQGLSERAVGDHPSGDIQLIVARAGAIDQRQGIVIHGGEVNGVVVGFNHGTIITVNVQTGTGLERGARPNIVRRAAPRPPLAPRQFHDREQPLRQLRREIQPHRGAWVTGQLGCGLTAVLHQAANTPAARAFADGVLFVDGAHAPAGADDLAQWLYNHFYSGDGGETIRMDPQAARSELSNLHTLFVLDRPRVTGTTMAALADTLAGRGAVLISGEGPAPGNLLDLALDGLPRQDALKLVATEARLDLAQAQTAELAGRLCAALGDLPLALMLAARLVRMRVAPLERFVAVAESMGEEREPLARAAQLALLALNAAEIAVLTALVRGTASDADMDTLLAASHQPPDVVEDALARMNALRLVAIGDNRYAVASASLRRVLARILPRGDERRNAAAFLAGAAALRPGDLAWLGREWLNLLGAARESLVSGNAAQAGALIKAVHPYLVLNGLWSGWGNLVDMAAQAAQAGGDLALRAWALHERGTRAGLLGDLEAAAAHLGEAQRLRLELGDHAGAAASAQNMQALGLLPPPPPPPPDPITTLPMGEWWLWAAVLLVVALVVALVARPLFARPAAPTPTSAPPPAATATRTTTPTPITPAVVATPTSTSTSTATDTPVPSDTPTPTATDTPAPPTDTPTPTATDTPAPPTDTPTVTDTPTPTATDTPTPTSVPRSPGPVMAFYYPWYEQSDWSSGKMSDSAAPPYSGGDDTTIRRHIQQAADAGIDVLVCAWFGPNEPNARIDPRCRRLLQLVQESGRNIKVAMFPDPASFVTSLYTPDGMAEALTVLQRDFFPSPAYFTYQGKPVVFFFKPELIGDTGAWQQLRQRVDPNFTQFWFGGTDISSYLDAFDAMYFFDISWEGTDGEAMASYAAKLDAYNQAHGASKPFIVTAEPGYDDTLYRPGASHVKDRAGGAYYRGTWQRVIDYNAAAVVLTSFNEFYEGSYIEPSDRYGTLYLDLTGEEVKRYRSAGS